MNGSVGLAAAGFVVVVAPGTPCWWNVVEVGECVVVVVTIVVVPATDVVDVVGSVVVVVVVVVFARVVVVTGCVVVVGTVVVVVGGCVVVVGGAAHFEVSVTDAPSNFEIPLGHDACTRMSMVPVTSPGTIVVAMVVPLTGTGEVHPSTGNAVVAFGRDRVLDRHLDVGPGHRAGRPVPGRRGHDGLRDARRGGRGRGGDLRATRLATPPRRARWPRSTSTRTSVLGRLLDRGGGVT